MRPIFIYKQEGQVSASKIQWWVRHWMKLKGEQETIEGIEEAAVLSNFKIQQGKFRQVSGPENNLPLNIS